MIITLPWPAKALSPNQGAYWAVKSAAKKKYRADCAWQAKAQGITRDWPQDGKIAVHLVFHQPDRRKRDHDNMLAAMKSGLDGLADAMGVNDHRFVISSEVSEEIGGMVKITVKNKGE